jgi:hypothetical protein
MNSLPDKATCCYNHPDRFATAGCVDCGKIVCQECRVVLGPKYLCKNCRQLLIDAHPNQLPEETLRVREREYSSFPKELIGVDGWLLYLCLSLALFVPVVTLYDAWDFYELSTILDESFQMLKILSIIANSLGVVIAAFSLYTAYGLGFVKPDAVSIAKLFFVCYFVHAVFRIVVVMIFNSAMSGSDPSSSDLLINPSTYGKSVIHAVIGYLYLKYSVRVRATYGL